MTYLVFDCLSDTEVGRFKTREEADIKRKQHGGECTHVFEIADPVEKPVEIKETKPANGMLF